MSDEKIKISWDDISRPEVDDKVRQHEAMARTQQHYAQFAGSTQVQAAAMGLWYNTIFYMALFGFIGGGVAWLCGETLMVALPDRREQFGIYLRQVEMVDEALARGEISPEEGEVRRQAVQDRYAANPFVEILTNPNLSDQQREEQLQRSLVGEGLRSLLQNIIWVAMMGVILSLALSVADHVVARNWRATIINGASGIALGLLGGIFVGLFINFLYSALGGGRAESSLAVQVFARTVGWAVLGLFLAVAPGVVLLNGKRFLIGLAGGFIGGSVGGVLFDLIARLTPESLFVDSAVLSRMVAITAIGLVAGLGTGLIELAAKSGWLRVVAGLIAGKQFVIYKNPTFIGSSPQCEIYLFKDAQVSPQHARIHAVPGGYDLEDMRSTTGTLVNGRRIARARLRNNDQIQIGSTTLSFQEKTRG